MSAFEIIGPPMIGPSSSHTAGACRIGWAGSKILGAAVTHARVGLHGSFLATGQGHGTLEALAAGLLGMAPDDDRLPVALELAQTAGVKIEFIPVDLGSAAHPNSVEMHLEGVVGGCLQEESLIPEALCSRSSQPDPVDIRYKMQTHIQASSVGGGSIQITKVDGFGISIFGTLETLLFWHVDIPGFLAAITAILAGLQCNVATIATGRRDRGEEAFTAVEIDGSLPQEVIPLFHKMPAVRKFGILPLLPGQ